MIWKDLLIIPPAFKLGNIAANTTLSGISLNSNAACLLYTPHFTGGLALVTEKGRVVPLYKDEWNRTHNALVSKCVKEFLEANANFKEV